MLLAIKLPRSAFEYRPWWSNNASNHVNADSWLRAGYKTENVDMTGRKLVFRKALPGALPMDRKKREMVLLSAVICFRVFSARSRER